MWPLVGLLMDRHPRLRAAAREPAIVLTALRSPVAALQLLEKLDAPLDDGLCASIRAWQRLPALVGATHKPECVRLLDVLVAKAPSLGAFIAQLREQAAASAAMQLDADEEGDEEGEEEAWDEGEDSEDESGGDLEDEESGEEEGMDVA